MNIKQKENKSIMKTILLKVSEEINTELLKQVALHRIKTGERASKESIIIELIKKGLKNEY